jgi:hypothetical protein
MRTRFLSVKQDTNRDPLPANRKARREPRERSAGSRLPCLVARHELPEEARLTAEEALGVERVGELQVVVVEVMPISWRRVRRNVRKATTRLWWGGPHPDLDPGSVFIVPGCRDQ